MHKRQFVLALLLFLLLFLVLNFVNAQTIQDYNLTYDANGNMIQGFGEYIEYDAWNRLSKIRNTNATGTVIAEYLYDHEGNRIKKIVYNSNGDGHNESTYYMNTRPADFIQVINTNGTIINETYIYLQDKLIAKYDTNGRKFFYHPDHLGSTALVTNESGDVVEDLLYLPYGDVLSGDEISRFTYTGQENDVESGFIDYGARQYDARFSRFIQPDPIISDVYNPQNLNRYSYVLNNPYKYVDPNGRSTIDIHFIASYGASRELGFGRIESLGFAYDSIQPDIANFKGGATRDSFFKEGEGNADYHLATEMSNSEVESILQENAQKFVEAYQRGDSDAGRYLHAFGDTVHPGGFPAGEGSSVSDRINHLIRDFDRDNIKMTKENIVKYVDPQIKDKDIKPKRLFDTYLKYGMDAVKEQFQKKGSPPGSGAWGWNPETGWWQVQTGGK